MKKWSSQWTQFMQLRKEACRIKNVGLQRGLNPWLRDYQCDALPTELWSHWRWELVNCGKWHTVFSFSLGQASCWTVQLGFVQCHVPHAMYWLRAIPPSGSYWTLAYAVQYDQRRDLLCCVHWYYVQFDHVYWFIGEALQWKGNATAVETQVIVLSILVWTETWTPQQSPK